MPISNLLEQKANDKDHSESWPVLNWA